MHNTPEKILNLDKALQVLDENPSFINAQKAATTIINLLGIPTNLGFIPISKVPGTVANQLELAEGYADKRAAYKYNIQDTAPFDLKLFWVQKASKRTISSLVALTPNFEDETFYIDKNIGIDIVIPQTTDRILLILSSSYNIRLVELKGTLTNTQKDIFTKWVQEFNFDNKRQTHTILWNSLDLKSLNESFYKEVAQFFSELKVHLKSNSLFNENNASHFANRLIGRLIFCWFIRKRGLINEVQRYLEVSPEEDSSTYYHSRLEKLFFSVLNTPIENRTSEDTETPYLNGGLFDPRDDDYKGNSSLTFPKDYFHRFFVFLNHYNFTTDESTSDYQQVAIDPEMLGKIFENLLAEQSEDTGEQARKAKGAFYTPREIVDYMCRQSIREYLKCQLSGEEDTDQLISDLIDTKEYAYDKNVREKITHYKQKFTSALDNLKVVDPACGSGAFPMGMLKLLERLYERIEVRYDPHRTKMEIIKNNLYGVDIEPMAIEIARLRAWLSIIVDDDINPNLPNKGIEPLPNLDFKFVCANSLIKIDIKSPKIVQLSIPGGETSEELLINKLIELRKQWFITHNISKQELKEEFKNTQKKLRDGITNNWIGSARKEDKLKLAEWDPFGEEPGAFFDPFWMFGIDNGFDIVIANPPYIRQEKIKYKTSLRDIYEIFNSVADLYTYFYERGINLLKENGVLSYITSSKFTRARYGKNLRRYLKTNLTLKSIVNFGDKHVFEAITNTLILIGTKLKPTDNTISYSNNIENPEKIKFLQNDLNDTEWTIEEPDVMSLKKKIESMGTPLVNWKISVNRGLLTGFNEAFVLNDSQRENLIRESSQAEEIIKPIIRGRDIGRYCYKDSKQYLIISHNGYLDKSGNKVEPINVYDYPSIKFHLDKYKDKLKERGDKGKTFYNLRDCAFMTDFAKDKIIWIELTNTNKFAYSDKEDYVLAGAFLMTGESLKYLLAFLNSKLCYFYFSLICNSSGMATIQWKKFALEKIPVIKLSDDDQKPFIEIVDKILTLKKADPKVNTSDFENKIDQMVYKLYDLTPEEIAIVENSK